MLDKIFITGTAKSVLGLGTTTTIGYGTLYYSFALMSTQFQNEFGWSKSFIFGIFSLGILTGGLLAPSIGKLLDNHGARIIMSVGSFLCALGLFFISLIQNEYQYIAAIIFLEIVSTLVLYEAAFVALSQLAGYKARLPITQITLIAGFASTIFWPLIGFLLSIMDWRDVYKILALFHIFLALPIHLSVLKKGLLIRNISPDEEMLSKTINPNAKDRKKILQILGLIFCLIAIPITVIQTHFIGLLSEFGVETGVAIGLGALIGPSQVGARIVEIFFTKKSSPILSGIFSTLIMALGLTMLLLSGYSIMLVTTFVIFYGAGQGLSSIIKGTIPLYIFGKEGYGRVVGGLNFYRIITTALVPFGFAFSLDNFGAKISTVILIVATISATILLILLGKKLENMRSLK